MKHYEYNITSKVWIFPGVASWHFATIPSKESEEIKTTFSGLKRGWGSFRVKVILGSSSWETSIFPDKRAGVFALPLKKDVRKKENNTYGDTISFVLTIKT